VILLAWLYIGRNGLKAAVNRASQTVKGIWTGPTAAAK